MAEHDDDLEPEVQEEAEEETVGFANTGDDVDAEQEASVDESLPDLDEDKSEL
jgi:hypothetical protein